MFFSVNILYCCAGPHTVNITYGGKHIPKSPFKVKINPAFDASKVKVTGPGIKPTGVKSMQPTYFEVDASEAGEGNVDIKIEPVGKLVLRNLRLKQILKLLQYYIHILFVLLITLSPCCSLNLEIESSLNIYGWLIPKIFIDVYAI